MQHFECLYHILILGTMEEQAWPIKLLQSLTLLNTVNFMTNAGQGITAHDHSSHKLILAVKSKE